MSQEFTPTATTKVAFTPVNSDFHVAFTAECEKGDLVTDKGTVERFRFTWNLPNSKTAAGMGAKPASAIAAMFKASGYATPDDYVFDVDTEFFAGEASRSNSASADDPWARDDADELAAMLRQAEHDFAEAEANEAGAQTYWRNAGIVVSEVYERLDRNGRALAKWAKGGDRVTDAPFMAKLGNGKNALSEARIIAEITDAQWAALQLAPTITRGKSVQKWIAESSATLYDVAASEVVGKFDNDGKTLSATQGEDAIETVFGSCGMTAPYDGLRDGALKLLSSVKAGVDEFKTIWASASEGKEAYEAARMVMGRITVAEDILAYLDAEEAYAALYDDKDATKEAKDAALKALTDTAFNKRVVASWTTQQNAKAADKRRASLEKAAEEAKALPGATKWAERSATDVAAQLWVSIRSHPSYSEIVSQLGVLARDAKAAERAAARETEEEAA